MLKNKAAVARLLIDRGANTALRDPEGRTLRELAQAPGREAVAALLT